MKIKSKLHDNFYRLPQPDTILIPSSTINTTHQPIIPPIIGGLGGIYIYFPQGR